MRKMNIIQTSVMFFKLRIVGDGYFKSIRTTLVPKMRFKILCTGRSATTDIYSLQYILGVKEKDKVSLHHLNPVLVHLTISDESTQ